MGRGNVLIYFRKPLQMQFVLGVLGGARALDFDIAEPDDARKILGLKGKADVGF